MSPNMDRIDLICKNVNFQPSFPSENFIWWMRKLSFRVKQTRTGAVETYKLFSLYVNC